MESPERSLIVRRTLLLGALAAPIVSSESMAAIKPVAGKPFGLKGCLTQGGFVTGVAPKGSLLRVDGVMRGKIADTGGFFVGFDRDAGKSCKIEIISGAKITKTFVDVSPVKYDIQRVDGLPQQTVTPTDPDIIKRIQVEVALKAKAFQSRINQDWFKDGFAMPLKAFRVSGAFGNQRVLNGVPKSPHYGFDMAAPNGTPIYAPAGGQVVLAEPDMFYEGGLTFIDHGQGLIAMYLHQSKVLVKTGDIVTRGQKIGEVGAKGRATGPHLCWRLKWSGRYLNPSLLVA